MSELSYVEITKTSPINLSIRINSFRDDSLPNADLQKNEFLKVATTGLVLYANYVDTIIEDTEQQEPFYQQLLELEDEIELTKFKEATVHYFIKEAQVSSFYNKEGYEYIHEMPFTPSPKQRADLYELQLELFEQRGWKEEQAEFLEEYPSAASNFYIQSLYVDYNQLVAIIGEENFKKIESHVTIHLVFKNEIYLTLLKEHTVEFFETSLDSHLYDWL